MLSSNQSSPSSGSGDEQENERGSEKEKARESEQETQPGEAPQRRPPDSRPDQPGDTHQSGLGDADQTAKMQETLTLPASGEDPLAMFSANEASCAVSALDDAAWALAMEEVFSSNAPASPDFTWNSPPGAVSTTNSPAPSALAATASAADQAVPGKASLNDLSHEVLVHIFEDVQEQDPSAVRALRLLSHRMNDIAVPISYNKVVINERLVAPATRLRYAAAWRNIQQHTRHVVVGGELHAASLQKILSGMRKLLSVTWRYPNVRRASTHLFFPADVLDPEQTLRDGTRLYVENLPLGSTSDAKPVSFLDKIPPDLLVSLEVKPPAVPLTTEVKTLKELLVRASNLESLSYEDIGQGTQLEFGGSERLAPLRHLSLRSYNWNYSARDVLNHWNLSKLRSLELVAVPILSFLKSVSFEDFAHLRSLHADEYSAFLPDQRVEATAGLQMLVEKHIRALDSLDITCHLKFFGLTAITRHGATLRSLKLRDHAGFGDEAERCPTLSVGSLTLLQRSLPHLEELELDMDDHCVSVPHFVHALNNFLSLRDLRLNVQTVMRPAAMIPVITFGDPVRDVDAVATARIVNQLEASKAHGQWEGIRVNVGGWKETMLRRASPSWRWLAEAGLHPERFFRFARPGGSRTLYGWEMHTDGAGGLVLETFDWEHHLGESKLYAYE